MYMLFELDGNRIDGNRIDGKTKQNQPIFNKFTYKYKQAKLYLSLSGTARQSKFEKVYKRVATI